MDGHHHAPHSILHQFFSYPFSHYWHTFVNQFVETLPPVSVMPFLQNITGKNTHWRQLTDKNCKASLWLHLQIIIVLHTEVFKWHLCGGLWEGWGWRGVQEDYFRLYTLEKMRWTASQYVQIQTTITFADWGGEHWGSPDPQITGCPSGSQTGLVSASKCIS